jgi:hypothetical protein
MTPFAEGHDLRREGQIWLRRCCLHELLLSARNRSHLESYAACRVRPNCSLWRSGVAGAAVPAETFGLHHPGPAHLLGRPSFKDARNECDEERGRRADERIIEPRTGRTDTDCEFARQQLSSNSTFPRPCLSVSSVAVIPSGFVVFVRFLGSNFSRSGTSMSNFGTQGAELRLHPLEMRVFGTIYQSRHHGF